jgi:hypothetical protein
VSSTGRVFCGPRIAEEAAAEINDIWDMTLALELVNFPLALPGTKGYKVTKASDVAHRHLKRATALAKPSVAPGHEPEWMLEQWERDLRAPGYKGRAEFPPCEISQVVFARPVATSSSVIHGFQHLVDDARFMAKARAERIALRRDDATRSVTMDMLSSTRSRTSWPRESIHVKPPVTMVGASRLYVLRPHLMSSQMPYKDHLRAPDYGRLHALYTLSAGAMVIPARSRTRRCTIYAYTLSRTRSCPSAG